MDIITIKLITNVNYVTQPVKLALMPPLTNVIAVGLGDSYTLILKILPSEPVLIHVQKDISVTNYLTPVSPVIFQIVIYVILIMLVLIVTNHTTYGWVLVSCVTKELGY
jgi:hypothetical protein